MDHVQPKLQHDALIQAAADRLTAGGLVAFPTDTVYGLGADAKNPAAIAKIYAAKNRPANRPLVVLISALDQLQDWVTEIPIAAQKLAKHFWPGALTLVLPNGDQSIGIRIPNHPVALALLKTFGSGIATTSANPSGQPSLITASQVETALGGAIDVLLEGECPVGIESTIVDLTTTQPKILRAGAISEAAIHRVLS